MKTLKFCVLAFFLAVAFAAVPFVYAQDAPIFGSVNVDSVTVDCLISSDYGLDAVIPSWNNSGHWTNMTAVDAGNATVFNANFTGSLNQTVENVVSVVFYANDSLGNWDVSGQYDFAFTGSVASVASGPWWEDPRLFVVVICVVVGIVVLVKKLIG